MHIILSLDYALELSLAKEVYRVLVKTDGDRKGAFKRIIPKLKDKDQAWQFYEDLSPQVFG